MKVYVVIYGGEIDSIWGSFIGAEMRKEEIRIFAQGLRDKGQFACNVHIENHEVEGLK